MNAKSYARDLAAQLRERGAFTSLWIEDAILRIPRHKFIRKHYEPGPQGKFAEVYCHEPTDDQLQVIYSDRGLLLKTPPDESSASQPSLVVGMLQDLRLSEGDKVLEIGTGSGWNAGLMTIGTGRADLVRSVDLQPEIVQEARQSLDTVHLHGVKLREADGGEGWPEEAPFDRIIVTVGVPEIPPLWFSQLGEDGVLLLPFKVGGVGDPILRLQKQREKTTGRFTRWAGFGTLRGRFHSAESDHLRRSQNEEIRSLLEREPVTLEMPQPVDINCVFFFTISGRTFNAVLDERGALGPRPAVYDQHAGSIFVCSKKPELVVYGNHDNIGRLRELQSEWISIGKPSIADFNVEVVTEDDAQNLSWSIRRQDVILGLSLRS